MPMPRWAGFLWFTTSPPIRSSPTEMDSRSKMDVAQDEKIMKEGKLIVAAIVGRGQCQTWPAQTMERGKVVFR